MIDFNNISFKINYLSNKPLCLTYAEQIKSNKHFYLKHILCRKFCNHCTLIQISIVNE